MSLNEEALADDLHGEDIDGSYWDFEDFDTPAVAEFPEPQTVDALLWGALAYMNTCPPEELTKAGHVAAFWLLEDWPAGISLDHCNPHDHTCGIPRRMADA